jgi:hypothetical protein
MAKAIPLSLNPEAVQAVRSHFQRPWEAVAALHDQVEV